MTSRPLGKGQQCTFKLQLFLKKIKKIAIVQHLASGGQGGAPTPPWLLKFSKIISVKQSLTDMEKKKKKKNGTSTWKWLWHRNKKRKKKFSHTKSCFCLFLRETCIYFIIFYFISLFTLFLLFMILFKVFYSWMMLEILQILLLMSYKLAYHQLQKIISKIYSLYF